MSAPNTDAENEKAYREMLRDARELHEALARVLRNTPGKPAVSVLAALRVLVSQTAWGIQEQGADTREAFVLGEVLADALVKEAKKRGNA